MINIKTTQSIKVGEEGTDDPIVMISEKSFELVNDEIWKIDLYAAAKDGKPLAFSYLTGIKWGVLRSVRTGKLYMLPAGEPLGEFEERLGKDYFFLETVSSHHM